MKPFELSMALLVLAGCSGTGASPGEAGRLELGLGPSSPTVTTQSNEAVETPSMGLGVSQLLVTINEVSVHSEWDGWKSVRTDSFTADLLSLHEHPIDIGTVTLSAGKVTQVRLITSGGSVITSDGQTHSLQVPSGSETGIKLDGPWFVGACQLVTLHLDFEPLGSVHLHVPGDTDPWVLNPVIHVTEDQPIWLANCDMLVAGPTKVRDGFVEHP